MIAIRCAWVAIGIAVFLQVAAATSLNVGMPTTPRTLDPARADIAQEFIVMAGIYDSLFALDPVARRATLVPLAAAELPEISADYRTYTIKVRRGIRFTPHPAFAGRPRELTARDFAYSIRRILDPRVRSPALGTYEGKIAGLDALAKRAGAEGRALDYDAPVDGLKLVDDYTLQITLNSPDPFFAYLLAGMPIAGVAREVVEAEGDAYGQRPIGTGGYMVQSFTPGQRLVLARNPEFRELRFEALVSQSSRADAHPLKGKRLPRLDRISLFSTPEASAELLALRQGEVDLIMLTAPEAAFKNGRLDESLTRQGMRLVRDASPLVLGLYFSMRDPVVGGDSREKVALRRAIAMAIDDQEWIRVIDMGQSNARTQWIPPGIDGHIAGYRNPNRFDPATANALLDRLGYKRGSDGYRRNPDGSALTVNWLIGTSSESRTRAEFMRRMMDRIGVRAAFEAAPSIERVRRMNQCTFGVAAMDWGLGVPDGSEPMSIFYGKAIGGANSSCFQDASFDVAYERALRMPQGPERDQLFRTMQERIDALVPARVLPTGDLMILTRPQVVGPFGVIGDWLQLLTIGVQEK